MRTIIIKTLKWLLKHENLFCLDEKDIEEVNKLIEKVEGGGVDEN